MIALLWFVLAILASPFKSKSRLEAENAALRRQLIVLRRNVHGRVRLTNNDRLFFVQLYRWFPSIRQVLTIVRPETLIRWHRLGFRCYWRWKSRSTGGRPRIESELRVLIRRMSIENPLWGAPRIHGELLKLGFEVAQSTVAKYMAKRPGPPSQGWRTFLRNHAPDIAAMDLFVVPTIGFDLLYAFVIVRLDRRQLVWINVTTNPTAEWIARQLTEAFPWDEAPRYLIRDQDRIYGDVTMRRIRAMGIRDKPIAPASPWQNGFAERLIGSIRRECVDHIVVWGEGHLRWILRAYARFSNRPFGVKHFQTIHQCSVDVAHGLALLFGLGTKALPVWDSRTRRNNLLRGLTVRLTIGPSGHANSPHPSSREGHLSTAGWSSGFLLLHLILRGFHAAATSRVQRNSVPSTHMRCMITANRRASATIAFFIPRRLATCIAQALSHDHFFECSSMLWAAS